MLGVAGVIVLYLGVNFVCVRALGAEGLAASTVPASAVMRLTLGSAGARLIALGIAISTLGFLSQSVLTAPRVYFAMASDGLFFRAVARVNAKTHVPVLAIVMQSVLTLVIALSGSYEKILNYVVSIDFIFFGLTGASLFVFRRRDAERSGGGEYRVPGHPFTTAMFVAVCWLVVINTIYKYPANTALGLGILALGVPVYWLLGARRKARGSVGIRSDASTLQMGSPYMEWAKLQLFREVQPRHQRHHELSAGRACRYASKSWRSTAPTRMAIAR